MWCLLFVLLSFSALLKVLSLLSLCFLLPSWRKIMSVFLWTIKRICFSRFTCWTYCSFDTDNWKSGGHLGIVTSTYCLGRVHSCKVNHPNQNNTFSIFLSIDLNCWRLWVLNFKYQGSSFWTFYNKGFVIFAGLIDLMHLLK